MSGPTQCPDCEGSGFIIEDDGNGGEAEADCPTCDGTGEVEDESE